MERFFSELQSRLDAARSADRHRLDVFFTELEPRLDSARRLERELNRHLAHRFNVLDYLRTDELGLSRVIADLLDPRASHGQGPLFLRVLVEKLKLAERWADMELGGAVVSAERVITAQRRIDIDVRIRSDGKAYCLAIENKPYAGDQENQVHDYLKHLDREFEGRFLLFYLSPAGEPPSEWSLPRNGLHQWQGRFAVMSYHGQGDGEETVNQDGPVDPFAAFRESFSLTDWLSACHEKCQVERLRWFLRDARLFCQRKFGDHHMTSDSEARAVQDYLLSEPDNLTVGLAVYESWPTVRDLVCKRFLEHLRRCIEQKAAQEFPDFARDIQVGCKFRGEPRWRNRLWLYRASWTQYGREHSDSRGRTSIRLEADGKGVSDWCFGVSSPMPDRDMTDKEKDRRLRLDTELKNALALGRRTDWWPQWAWAADNRRHWNDLVPDLQRECNDGRGEITDYFVGEIMDVAVRAIPVINEIEGNGA